MVSVGDGALAGVWGVRLGVGHIGWHQGSVADVGLHRGRHDSGGGSDPLSLVATTFTFCFLNFHVL